MNKKIFHAPPLILHRVCIKIATFLFIICFSFQGNCGELRLYTEESPPGNFVKDGKITGVCTEMVQGIQKKIGDTTAIQVVPWARGYRHLLNEPNVGLFSTAYTPQRAPLFHWVGPFYQAKFVFFARKDTTLSIHSLDDARHVTRIGTYKNDAREQFLVDHGFTNLERSNNNILNYKKLMHGHLDLFFATNLEVQSLIKQKIIQPDTIKEVFIATQCGIYLALSQQTDPKTVAAWQKGFETLIQYGEYKIIYDRWFPSIISSSP